jgi:hypothetical protein
LKHIKQVTTEPGKFPGIPIYVRPESLGETRPGEGLLEKVRVSIDLKQQAVKVVLQEALREFRLSYIVKDGLLMIDSRDVVNEMRLEQLERKLNRVLEVLERLPQARPGGNIE